MRAGRQRDRKQAGRQVTRQATRQADNQVGTQPLPTRWAGRQKTMQPAGAGTKPGNLPAAGNQARYLAGNQAGRQVTRHTCRKATIRTGRHAASDAGKLPGRQ